VDFALSGCAPLVAVVQSATLRTAMMGPGVCSQN